MLRRLTPLLVLLAGIGVGFLGWIVAGGTRAVAAKLDEAEASANRLRGPRSAGSAAGVDVGEMAARPVFILTTGPGATPEPAVRLDGVVKARGRHAALLSLNDRPPEWLSVGDVRDGVTLLEVHGGKVVVDTVFGPKDVALGMRIGPAAAPPAAGSIGAPPPGAVQPTIVDQIPPGFRSPAPPASAPGTAP